MKQIRRIFIMLLVCGILLSLVSCKKTEETHTKEEKTAKQILCDYIMENGANYQGVYKIIELDDDSLTTISCTEQGDISFSYYSEGKSANNTSVVVLNFYEGSVTQSVEYEYEQQGYTCTAKGTLYTQLISVDDCDVVGITYRDTFPSSISDSTIEKIASQLFPLSTKAMMTSVNYMLIKYVDIQLSDLGFTNW